MKKAQFISLPPSTSRASLRCNAPVLHLLSPAVHLDHPVTHLHRAHAPAAKLRSKRICGGRLTRLRSQQYWQQPKQADKTKLNQNVVRVLRKYGPQKTTLSDLFQRLQTQWSLLLEDKGSRITRTFERTGQLTTKRLTKEWGGSKLLRRPGTRCPTSQRIQMLATVQSRPTTQPYLKVRCLRKLTASLVIGARMLGRVGVFDRKSERTKHAPPGKREGQRAGLIVCGEPGLRNHDRPFSRNCFVQTAP